MPTGRVIKTYILKKFASLCDCNDSHKTDSFIVSTYIRQNKILVENNKLLLEYIVDDDKINSFIDYLNKKNIKLSLEDLIVFFEFVISPQDKEVNGAVYTPEYIRHYIVDYALRQLGGDMSQRKYADIACGCGGFLVTIAQYLHTLGISYEKIFKDCLYGADIAGYSITRTKLMLSLLALSEEDVVEYNFNLIRADSLSFDWNTVQTVMLHGGFDAIVGNPPYVSASKIDNDTLTLVKSWEVSKSGKADMYIPFFQIGIENLVEDGILGYITVNNFVRSVNGRALRKYIIRRKLDLTIIDFGAEQVFPGRSTYTCLCFAQNVTNGKTYYTTCSSKGLKQINNNDYVSFDYSQLEKEDAWPLTSGFELPVIKKIRNWGIRLDDYVAIRNGFATLRNDVYLFTYEREDEQYYYLDSSMEEQRIEKTICRDAIKGNVLRSAEDVEKYSEKLIFPYKQDVERRGIIPISELEMQTEFPHAYHYLVKRRNILNDRSNSSKIQPWYSYGRSQALNNTGYKLLFPYIADNPYFILCENPNMMFYNGYAIIDKSLDKLRYLQKLLNSKIFWYYIKKTSKPYGGDYYALSKNYVKDFGVPELNAEAMNEFMCMTDEEAEAYLEKLYFGEVKELH